jgi:hypothetical protein
MDFKKLADQAKAAIDKRGGTDSVKEDLGELKDIASGGGSFADKAKEAADALKDPGDSGADVATSTPPPAEDPAADPARHGHGQGRHGQGKHRGNRPGR